MTSGIRRAVLVASLVASIATSCSTVVPGPSPFPPRPTDVAVDGIPPCSMLDRAQQAALGLLNPTSRTVSVNGYPSAICTWTTDSGFGYNVQSIPVGAELALSEPDATRIDVDGFGAVRSVVREMTGGAPTCQVTIDAAPGRAVRVQARAVPRPPLPTDDEMCRLATDAASMVMATVTGPGR